MKENKLSKSIYYVNWQRVVNFLLAIAIKSWQLLNEKSNPLWIAFLYRLIR